MIDMNRTLRTSVILLGITLVGIPLPVVAAASESNALLVQLEVTPARTIVALPVRLSLSLRNQSSTPIPVPSRVALRVVPLDREPFIAATGGEEDGSVALERATIPAHGEHRIVFSTFGVAAPPWFVDPRLNMPGTYRLDALLSDAPIGVDTPVVGLESSANVLAISNSAILAIDQPRGEDLAVWMELKKIAADQFQSRAWSSVFWGVASERVATFVWKEHPRSAYAPYVLPLLPLSTAEKLELARNARSQHPEWADNMQYQIGGYLSILAREEQTEHRRDLRKALDYARQARAELTPLLGDDDPKLRIAASEALQSIRSDEAMIALDRELERASRAHAHVR